MAIEFLNEPDFKSKVFDFNIHNIWQFEGKKPCIIDFYADWCAPCHTLSPILEELKNEYQHKLDIYKVDTEKERNLTTLFNIKNIPSLLFVPLNGKPKMIVGARGKQELVQLIKEYLDL